MRIMARNGLILFYVGTNPDDCWTRSISLTRSTASWDLEPGK